MRRADYLDKVAKALHHARNGDIEQVHLNHEIEVNRDALSLDVYRRLRPQSPSPYRYLLNSSDLTLVGASPESFLRIEAGRINMPPIAGSTPRGKTPEEDAPIVQRLCTDEKELAERLLLVDLCPNDIGRVCKLGPLEERRSFAPGAGFAEAPLRPRVWAWCKRTRREATFRVARLQRLVREREGGATR